MPRIGPRWCRTSGRRTARVHPAMRASRAIGAATAGRSARTRPCTEISGRSAGCAACPATARRTASAQRPPGPRIRTADRVTEGPPRTAKSRCIRLCCNVTGDSRRPAQPTRPARPRSPTRRPSGGSTGVPDVGPVRDRAVDMAYSTGSVACHEAYGPAVPKSVTDNATRWPNRSASAAHDVPNAAARDCRRPPRCRPCLRVRSDGHGRRRCPDRAPRCACWRCAMRTECLRPRRWVARGAPGCPPAVRSSARRRRGRRTTGSQGRIRRHRDRALEANRAVPRS